jgi:hypothetical protein
MLTGYLSCERFYFGGRDNGNVLKDFYNKMHITHIGLEHILRLELRL